MPLYEYKCHSCGKIFEVLQKFADEPLKTHPDCGGEVKRLFSAPAFHLKGTGWYATDYAKNSGSTAKGDDHKADKGDPSSHDKQTDKKKDKSDSKTESSSSASDSSPSSSPATESKPAPPETKSGSSNTSTVSSDK
ncbi:MAG TPA: zinc ribbon domain-containing protein [Bryobacteraceae bacterium]|jgi:putative FmdB family regulatory protein|nr:zinc ribbon domain-containing protein [Bryobacteraceae bacterium]